MYNNNWNHSCDYCNSSCVTCTGPDSSSCISCNTASFKILTNVTGGYCLASCPTIAYFTSGTICLACDTTCYTCSGIGSNQCTSCLTGLFLSLVTTSAGYCRYVCPQSSYPDTPTKKCLSCDQSCTFCFGSTINNCTACISGMVLYNFTCTTKCPTGLTVNQWKVCYESFYAITFFLLLLLL
jgi:proprotein convertase subtilisin/kexin type 5